MRGAAAMSIGIKARGLVVACSAALAVLGTGGLAASAAAEPAVSFGPSDADSIELLTGTYWGPPSKDDDFPEGAAYWWDHTDLTIAVRAAPDARPADVQAMHDAIAVWSSVLAARLPEISLTDVTDEARNPMTADIVLHLVPHTGGWAWGGYATCGNDKCKLRVKSDWPRGTPPWRERLGTDIRDPLRNQRTAIHEIGHALGLGHVDPLLSSIDIMGYGWAEADPDVTPILSDCDIEGIRTVFGWFYNNEPPHPSPVAELPC